MPPPRKYPIDIAPEYVAELRARVEAAGVNAVALAAGLSRQTVWRQLAGGDGRKPSVDGIEQIRRALAEVEPGATPMPPPIVAVRSGAHHAWIQLADRIARSDLERIADDPAPLLAMTKRPARGK